jgi:hypothetical protein
MIRSAAPERESRYLFPSTGEDERLRFEWFRTMGARLIYDGAILTEDRGPVGAIDFLRLVHVSPRRDPRPNPRGEPSPLGWVWERVPGAVVEARGAPGDTLSVTMRIRYPAGRYEMTWPHSAVCGADGLARLRVPYATDAPNGDGIVVSATWRLGDREGVLDVPESRVLRGGALLASPEMDP